MLSRFRKFASSISENARRRRADLFRSSFKLDAATTVLDLGSQDGAHVNLVLDGTIVNPGNVCIADLQLDAMAAAQNKFGYRFAVIEEDGDLPFEDNSFDIVFCSSVIEHVTVPKEDVWKISDGSEFFSRSWISQRRFADEIRRVGRGYFVQTPNRNFPIESHTWLPLAGVLPRRFQMAMIRFANKFWLFYSEPDFNLLDRKQLAELFPEARIICERKFGLVKSIMAVNSGANKIEKEKV